MGIEPVVQNWQWDMSVECGAYMSVEWSAYIVGGMTLAIDTYAHLNCVVQWINRPPLVG